MGCSTSCQTFDRFATSLQCILTSPSSSCAGLQSFIALANCLNIPLRADKTVLPSTLVILHGIEYRRKKLSLRQLQSLIGSLNFACT